MTETLSNGIIERVEGSVAKGSVTAGPLAPRSFELPARYIIRTENYSLQPNEPMVIGRDRDRNMFILVYRENYGLKLVCDDDTDNFVLYDIMRVEGEALHP